MGVERLPAPRMRVRDGLLIPRRVTIETLFGCDLHCPMCPVHMPSKRKKGLMPWELFTDIIDTLVPFRDDIEMMDLYSLGEPLLDRLLFERIKYAKGQGFRNLGISTNANQLSRKKQELLLESGIDTVIFSIDGATKETYEKIRVGGTFEKTVSNCLAMIERRNEGDYQTRFLVRFVRQNINRHEWPEFSRFWNEKIDRSRRDFLGVYDVHTGGGATGDKDEILASQASERDESIERVPCYLIFDILNILADGTVPLCHEDWLNGNYNFGNVRDTHPIEVFNSPRYQEIRELHSRGDKTRLKECRDCMVLYSDSTKQYL